MCVDKKSTLYYQFDLIYTIAIVLFKQILHKKKIYKDRDMCIDIDSGMVRFVFGVFHHLFF